MKSVNHIVHYGIALAVLWLVGCASNPTDNIGLALEKSPTVTLLETSQYLPQPEFDDAGVMLPYERKENPYLAKSGRIKKSSVESYIEARRAFRDGNHETAQSLLAKLTEDDKSLSGPWVMKGDIALQQNDLQQALDHYVAAIRTNTDNVSAYLRLAKTQRLRGEYLNAQNTYAKVLALWPDCPEAHLNLGVLYDVYMNHPLRAQKHMEAYQFLTGGQNAEVSKWLEELQKRTGVEFTLGSLKAEPVS